MESTEEHVSEEDEQAKTDHLTEHQRKVFEALRQMNVHGYCPPTSQLTQRTGLDSESTEIILKELCRLGIVVWRVDASGNDTWRLTRPDEFIRKERLAAKRGGSVSPNQDRSSTSTVSPKVQPTVQAKVLSCPKCDFVTKSYAGLHIHIGRKHKTAATVKQKLKAKKKEHAPDPPAKSEPLVTIILTPEEALETGIALALADKIDETRFANSHEIASKVLEALAELIIDEAHLEAS